MGLIFYWKTTIMTLIIAIILLLSYFFIATESFTHLNKAAVAMFAGTVGWVLYISFGTDFVMSRHPAEYIDFLSGDAANSVAVKYYIAQNIFLKYVGKAAEIVLFLLATMTIVEILNNNGCFDFVTHLLRTRNSRKLLWMLSGITFVISANLDNLTTTTMMLVIMHKIVTARRLRLFYGAAIVLAANCGGLFTVIGSPETLVLWNMGAVTATDYSMSLLLPCLTSWGLSTWWIGRSLPERIETESVAMPFRGDETNLKIWQRVLMFFVAIGGLWFIPTFHNITKLSPFLGALCVLAVLWIVHEVANRKLMNADQMIHRQVPRVLQYGTLQMMLFVMGMMLALGVVAEAGVLSSFADFFEQRIGNIWSLGIFAGAVSCFVDNFATSVSFFLLHTVVEGTGVGGASLSPFVQNGDFWKLMAYCVTMGGNVLCIGSMSGLAFMKMENMCYGWYFRNIGWKTLIGSFLGLGVLWLSLM